MLDGLQHPEPNLQTTALRYAAGDLTAAEAAAFEVRLAEDQEAREALSEAVRLSAAALGQSPPTPHHSFRDAIRERLAGWCPAWLSRRAYRGHPLAWAGLGAVAVAACTLIGLSLAGRPQPTDIGTPLAVAPSPRPAEAAPVAIAPAPHEAEVFVSHAPMTPCCGGACDHPEAEFWAELSTPDHVQKAHDDELKWRLKLHNAVMLHPGRPALAASAGSPGTVKSRNEEAMSLFARSAPVAVLAILSLTGAAVADPLPKFTEEREAAALHFVRKHCPELVPLLEDLKKNNRPAYESQIRETFQVTELLADLQDDQKRYDLELKIWKAENKAFVLVAKLATPKDEERKAIEEQLQGVAKELVELEVHSLEHRIALLQMELTSAKDELNKFRDNLERTVKERFEALLEKAKKKKP